MRLKLIKPFALISFICLSSIPLPNQAKTLIYCAESSPKYLSPPYALAGDMDIVTQVFDRLVEFELNSTKIRPGLAESWEVSPDGLTYTFHLRKGVKFHSTKNFKPTRDFNADDVVFSFERQFKEDHPYHKVSGGNYTFFESIGLSKIIKDIKKLDDHTVQFNLKQPASPLLLDLAMTSFGSIMSAEFADKMMQAGTSEKFDLIPIGTGPFIFLDYQKDAAIRFKANSDYWRGKPKVDHLVFSITTDPGIRLAKLEKGECHILPNPNLSDIDKLRKDPNIALLEQEGMNVGFLALNTRKKPLDDIRVRKALAMAINKQAIVDAVFQSYGKQATNPIPPTLWGYNEDIKDYPYDSEQAKKLLAEAGYPDGFKIDLWALPVPRPYNPNGKRTAELIQADWAEIGVKANIISYEWGEHLKRAQAGEHQAFIIGWRSDTGDPDNFLHTLFSCEAIEAKMNLSFWCNKTFDNLALKAKKIANIDERAQLYKEMQMIFHKDLPAIPLTHSRTTLPVRKEVENYIQHPLSYHYLYDVDLKEN